MFIIDAHLDLAMNALEWNRDIRKSVTEIRQLEVGMNDYIAKPVNLEQLLSLMRVWLYS